MGKNSVSLPQGTLVPNHLAIIPDGNRRWARARGLPTFEGHRRGFDIIPEIARACRDFGVHTVTIWAFSTENWDRSKEEIGFLMKKYEDFVDQHLKEAQKNKVQIIHLGRKDRIPTFLVKKLLQAEKATQSHKKYILNVALDYGGRDEILRATKKMLSEGLDPKMLDEKVYCRYLDTYDQPYPYPDLIIRTSGEQRLSGLLPWQASYAEFYFLKEHFPDFTTEKLKEVILEYSRRRRRFGGSDDVPKVQFDPKVVGELETDWWRERHESDQKRLWGLLAAWVKELYGLGEEEAKKATKFLISGMICHDQREWERALGNLKNFYRIIKEKTHSVFNPEVVAQLEVSWWQTHDALEDSLDKWRLERGLSEFYGELYRLSELQTPKIAHLKALATLTHDQAEANHLGNGERELWKQTKDYLVKSYEALREVAS